MFGLGTIINTVLVILGGIIGLFFKKGIKDRYEKTLMAACGVSTIFIGVTGTLQGMLTVADGKIQTQGTMLLIFSFVLGGLIGEFINIEKRMDNLGEKLKKLFHAEKDNKFVDGFVNTSLIICVGAMAIVGSIQDGLTGDYSMLTAKAVLDLVIVVIMTSTYGLGAICSAIPIFVYQGGITLLGHFAGNIISDELIGYLSYIGSALIFCVGINITFGKKIKVGNLLPALIIPVVYVFGKYVLEITHF
ncbi:MAG: DUF554 domain-containing protein [Clostridia bacterium]|nr:DUF554 domain-containing protein [Clostridia bacterium]